MPKIIKIDFDGTIVEDKFPQIGDPLPGAIDVILDLQNSGYHLILWTCRNGTHLEDAVSFLRYRGIVFDVVNRSHPQNPFAHLQPGPKPYAHYHIDDKNFGGFPGWDVIRKYFFEEKKYHQKTPVPSQQVNKDGFWNGEPASFTVISYEVLRNENKNHWQNMFVGEKRQGVLITQYDQSWLIDNQHGDGYCKVTIGMGSPRYGHKSVVEHNVLGCLPESEWKTVYNSMMITKEGNDHDQWIQTNSPEDWKKIEGLRKMIEKSRS